MITTTLTKDQTATKINLTKSPGTNGVSGNTSTPTKALTGTRRFISKNPGGTVISLSKNDLQEYPITAAQFPELIEGFTAAGISGGTLTGVLGTVSAADTWVVPSAGQFRGTTAPQTTSGTWGAVGTKYGLMLQTGSFVSSIVPITTFGNTSSGSYLTNRVSTGIIHLSGTQSITSATEIAGLTAPLKSIAILLDQSPDTGWGFKYAIDSLNVGGYAPLTTLTGDISASFPAFTIGASGINIGTNASSYYEGIWLFAFNNRPSNETIFAAMQWMSDHPGFIYPGFANTSVAGSILGTNSILASSWVNTNDSLFAFKYTLSSSKTAISAQFYVETAGGTIRLGIYDNTGVDGLPGRKLAETDEFTPNVGWNNRSFKTPVLLPAGDYYLTFISSSASLSIKYANTGGTRIIKSQAYGNLPSTFPSSPTSDTVNLSFYILLV